MNDFEINNNRRKRMRLHLVPPDDTDMSAVADEETLSSMSSDDDLSHIEQQQYQLEERHSSTPPPQSFICPLTMEIMFDPVLDGEGNSFERAALLDWLHDNRESPVSRQPFTESRLIPNAALRQIIHDVMGPEWVSRKREEQERRHAVRIGNNEGKNGEIPTTISVQTSSSPASCAAAAAGISPSRARINCFLQTTEKALGIPNLSLNEEGCCAFQQEGVTIVLDVPESIGVFCLYTRDLLPEEFYLNSKTSIESVYRTALELNFLQGDTRGGCLSIRQQDDDDEESRDSTSRPEIMFSYTDRVREVGAQDFTNILLNFLDTAKSLRDRLVQATQEKSCSPVSLPTNGSGN